MIQSALIFKPVFDRTTFQKGATKVTARNHIRSTDARNLSSQDAETSSILEDFGGYTNVGEGLIHLGFLFIGPSKLVSEVPEIVPHSSVLTTPDSTSDLICAMIVVASLADWKRAIDSLLISERSALIKDSFVNVAKGINLFTHNGKLLRLN